MVLFLPAQMVIEERLTVLGRMKESVCHSWSLEGKEEKHSPAEGWVTRLAGVCSK